MGRVSNKKVKNQKRSSLHLSKKLEILKDLDKGVPVSDIMNKFKIDSASTIYTIKYSKNIIQTKLSEQQVNLGKINIQLADP